MHFNRFIVVKGFYCFLECFYLYLCSGYPTGYCASAASGDTSLRGCHIPKTQNSPGSHPRNARHGSQLIRPALHAEEGTIDPADMYAAQAGLQLYKLRARLLRSPPETKHTSCNSLPCSASHAYGGSIP